MKIAFMEQASRKRKAGRPRVKDKVKLVSIYLRTSERASIEKRFGRVQDAVQKVLVPMCE